MSSQQSEGLQDLVSCSRKDILNANVTYEIIMISIYLYPWQLVYSHDVIDTNASFHFLSIGEKVFSVLLQIEVALMNK